MAAKSLRRLRCGQFVQKLEAGARHQIVTVTWLEGVRRPNRDGSLDAMCAMVEPYRQSFVAFQPRVLPSLHAASMMHWMSGIGSLLRRCLHEQTVALYPCDSKTSHSANGPIVDAKAGINEQQASGGCASCPMAALLA